MPEETKTLTEYIAEAITFFQEEYAALDRIKGFKYDYFLSELHTNNDGSLHYEDEYEMRLKAFHRLRDAGIITESKEQTSQDENGVWLYAVCKINEDRLPLMEEKKDLHQIPTSDNGTILYYDRDGNVWHGDKANHCYPMGAKSNRFKLFQYLVENKGLQSIDNLASFLATHNKQGIRTEIAKVRLNIQKFLGLDGDDVIESKKGSGYGINPKYKVVAEK